MERWERPPARRVRTTSTSFSSSLLDAIYRSIDDGTDGGGAKMAKTGGERDRSLSVSLNIPKYASAVSRLNHEHHRRFLSTSSDSSSFGGFSSSDADSTIYSGRAKPGRTGPILTRSEPIRSDPGSIRLKHDHRRFLSTSSSSDGGFSSSSDADSAIYSGRTKPFRTGPFLTRSDPPTERKKPGSIRSKLRDLRKSRSPASPGGRFAGFLNAIFAAAGNPKKAKIAAATSATATVESSCPSASSYSRSCLSKKPSSRGRSVRFGHVSVIVGDLDFPPAAPARDMSRNLVKELLRGFELEEEEEDGGESDSSSDLFELENLSAIGRLRDELPVYETTNLGTNRAIAQGLIV